MVWRKFLNVGLGAGGKGAVAVSMNLGADAPGAILAAVQKIELYKAVRRR
jgi:hypothetical protein